MELEQLGSCLDTGAIGAFALSRDGRKAHFVGRSIEDLRVRIPAAADPDGGYRYFACFVTTTAREAFERECEAFHAWHPSDNCLHPRTPPGARWRCPERHCDAASS